MSRDELLKSPEYWAAGAQIDLYNQARVFMEKNHMSRKDLAEYLGVSKGYVTQLLSGDYDHRMSKFFELALAFGVIPKIEYVPVEEYISGDSLSKGIINLSFEPNSQTSWSKEIGNCSTHNLTAYSSGENMPKEAA